MKPQDRTRAIGRSKLPTGQKAVLWAISDRMGANDTSYPGIPDICAFSSLSPGQVKKHIKALDSLGVLIRKFRPGTMPPIYSIRWDALGSVKPEPHKRGGKRTRAKTDPVATGAKTAPLTGSKTALRSDQGSDQEATTTQAPTGADHQEPTHGQTAEPNHRAVMERSPGPMGPPPDVAQAAQGGAGLEPALEVVADREGGGGAQRGGGSDAAQRAWDALNAAVGRSWSITPKWRKWLTDGAKAFEGGWDDWHMIADWVANGSSAHGDAEFHRKRRDPETLIRAGSRHKWRNQAQDWRDDMGLSAASKPDPKRNGKPQRLPTGEPTRLFV